MILEEVEPGKVSRYGVLKGRPLEDGLYQVEDLVEKPSPAEAPSNLVFAGRYVFTPEIFDFLQNTPPGKGGEIQLTDAMRAMLATQAMVGKKLQGKRYDIGHKEGFIKTNIEFGLQDPDIQTQLRTYLKDLVQRLWQGAMTTITTSSSMSVKARLDCMQPSSPKAFEKHMARIIVPKMKITIKF